MPTYTTQATPQPQIPTKEVPVIGNGGAAVAISLVSILIGKWMPWGDLAKQFVGARTSTALMSENRKNQEIEGEIDLNRDLTTAIADIARSNVDYSAESNKELLNLLKGSIEAAASHAQSTQLLTEAKKHHAEATADIAKAMMHVAEALESLTKAQEALPREIKLANEIHASEFRLALDNIDQRLEESNKLKKDGYTAIHEEIKRAETRIIEQYTGTFAQLRRDLKELENAVKRPKPD